jgi:hypothetical protein
MIDTKAVRALADEASNNNLIGRYGVRASEMLRQCADVIERQAEALTILDGFKGPPPTKDQWNCICALALALKEALK